MFKHANDSIKEFIASAFNKEEALKGLEDLEARRKAMEVANKLRGESRRSGRTTRIVDAAIQELFTKGKVMIVDHHGGDQASRFALSILINRLKIEHRDIAWLKTGPHSVRLKNWPL